MLARDLERYGPQTPQGQPPGLREAHRYCRRLARRHYENFTVASWFLPHRLRQHVANIYAYCRWADDLADETDDPQRALALLDWWEASLRDSFRGASTHPVFVALSETARAFHIPIDPFLDLLTAFRQDQSTTRYETFEQIQGYCRYSANPVGRLVLHLGECCTPDRVRLSNSICTGLQLANFCQDVARDWDRGRIYLAQAVCRRFGYEETNFAHREYNDAFRQTLALHVDQAENFLRDGLPLAQRMPGGLRLPVALFAAGGLAILRAIRLQHYDVWRRRPTLSKWEKLRLTARWWQRLRSNRKNIAVAE